MTYLSERQKQRKKNKKTTKLIPNYNNQYRKKRWSKKIYKVNNFNMRGGAVKNIYVFIRPFYMKSDEEIVQDKTSIFYYGDFNLKTDCTSTFGIIEYIKNKNLEEKSAFNDATFQMLISTFGTKQYTKMLNLFPNSNSRPKLNDAREKHEIYLEEVNTNIQPIVTLRTSFVTKYSVTLKNSDNNPIKCFIALRSLVKTNNYLQSIYDYLAGNCYVEFGLILPHTEKNFFGRYAYNFDLQDAKLDTDITNLTQQQKTIYNKYLEDEQKLDYDKSKSEDAIIKKFKEDNTMKDEIETLVNYPEFFITRNRISEQIDYSNSVVGSISKNHRLLVTRSKNWKRFNVLTMGLGGDIKSFEDDIAFLSRMKEAALHYIEQTRKKLSWPIDLDNIGLFFHCFPQNSIDVLHLHIVDIESYNTTSTPVKFGYKNLHIDDVINQLKSELNTMRNNLFLQFKAAYDDIDELKKLESLLTGAGAICVKTVPRHNRCSIFIYKIEENWYFEIIPIKTTSGPIVYKLNQQLVPLFDAILSHVINSKKRLKHLNKSEEYGMESIITTYGGDLWFVCYKLSHILGYSVKENDNDINMDNYFKYIKLALELMTEQPTTDTQDGGFKNGLKSIFDYIIPKQLQKQPPPQETSSINLYLCNDSLDNDIDDILAILFIECMIHKYKTNITLHYKEDNTLKWSGTSDTDRQVVKTTIIDKISYYMTDLTSGIFTDKLTYSLLPSKSSKSS